jgi:hypothetical protein
MAGPTLTKPTGCVPRIRRNQPERKLPQMQLHDRERLRLYAAHQELIVGPLRRAQAAELRSLNALRDEPDPRSEAKAQEYDELAFLAEESVRQIRTDLAIRRPVVKGWTVPRPRARGAGRPAVRGASKRSSARSGDSGGRRNRAAISTAAVRVLRP